MKAPHIAICIPSGDTWKTEMALALTAIVRGTPMEICVLNITGSQISFQRNELVKRALEAGSTHLFWLDSDIVAPPSILIEMLGHQKDIVGATYLRKIEPFSMLGEIGRGIGRLKPAALLPGGCMMVRAEVYEKLGWPWYFEQIVESTVTWKEGSMRSEDYSFCKKATDKGYEIWCDINMSQRISHLGGQSIRMQLKEGHPDRVSET